MSLIRLGSESPPVVFSSETTEVVPEDVKMESSEVVRMRGGVV